MYGSTAKSSSQVIGIKSYLYCWEMAASWISLPRLGLYSPHWIRLIVLTA